MHMRVYKQFYMIFVLMRACLWNVSSSFAGNSHADLRADHINRGGELTGNAILIANREVIYVADNNITEQEDFLGTPASRTAASPVFHRDKKYERENINGERARFLRLLLFPNHSFG